MSIYISADGVATIKENVHDNYQSPWKHRLRPPKKQALDTAAGATLAPEPAIPAADKADLLSSPEFPRFPLLPAEIRLKIWRQAAFEPRIETYNFLQICPLAEKTKARPYAQNVLSFRYAAGAYPGVLGANVESRAEVLKVVAEWKVDLTSASTTKFYRPDIDISYVRYRKLFARDIDARTRNLIRAEPHFSIPNWVCHEAAPLLAKLKALQGIKNIAIDRELLDAFTASEHHSFWHLQTWLIQCAFVHMERMIVALRDRSCVYAVTQHSGAAVPMCVPARKAAEASKPLVMRTETEGVEEEKGAGQGASFRAVVNNTAYAAHVREELGRAKAYLDADPVVVRRTIPLSFEVLSSE